MIKLPADYQAGRDARYRPVRPTTASSLCALLGNHPLRPPPARPNIQTVAPERKSVPANAAAASARRARSRYATMFTTDDPVSSQRHGGGSGQKGVDAVSLIGAERGATRPQLSCASSGGIPDARKPAANTSSPVRNRERDPAPGRNCCPNRVATPRRAVVARPFKKIIGMP